MKFKLTKKKCFVLVFAAVIFVTLILYFCIWLPGTDMEESGNVLQHNYKLLPNTVHYVWCGECWFEFHHYLSIKSVLREVKPDLIIFHYNVLPTLDEWIYNTWFDELKKEFPFIYTKPAGFLEKICLDRKKANPEFINKQLRKHGGMYVHEQTMFLQFPIEIREYDFIKGTDYKTGYGFLLAKKGFPPRKSHYEIIGNSTFKIKHAKCISSKSLKSPNTESLCQIQNLCVLT